MVACNAVRSIHREKLGEGKKLMRDLYIDASHEVLEDLKIRLRGARFPVVLDEQENSAGISVEFEKSRGLLAYRV